MRRYLLIAMIIVAAAFAWLLYRDNVRPLPPQPSGTLPHAASATVPPATETPSSTAKPADKPAEAAALGKAALKTPIAFMDNAVPFTVQAPSGEWDDERQQDGCEEASALMAVRWVQGKGLSAGEARREILAISDYEQAQYGEFRDISIEDVRDWIFKDYFKYAKVAVRRDVSADDIIAELQADRIVVTPMQGQKLKNPYFSGAGPERHMLLIRGYDPATKEFITNDPGTRRGEGYRYKRDVIMNALLAYETGNHVPMSGEPKGIVVVGR